MRGRAVLARAVPAGSPELPANLEGDGGLAGAGGHREQQPRLALEDGLDGAVDGDLLVVPLALADVWLKGVSSRSARLRDRRCPLPAR